MVASVGIALLTITWSEQRAPALRELRTMILEPALFYVLLRRAKLSRLDVLRIVDTLLIAALVVCLIGFTEYLHIAGTGGVIIAEQGSQRGLVDLARETVELTRSIERLEALLGLQARQ